MKYAKFIKVLLMSMVLTTLVGCNKETVNNEYDMSVVKGSNVLANDITDVIIRNVPFDDMEKIFNKYKNKIEYDVFDSNFNLKNPEIKYLYTFDLDDNFYIAKSTLKYSEIGVSDKKGEYTILKYYTMDINKTKEAKDLGIEDKDYTQDVQMKYKFNSVGKLIDFKIFYN